MKLTQSMVIAKLDQQKAELRDAINQFPDVAIRLAKLMFLPPEEFVKALPRESLAIVTVIQRCARLSLVETTINEEQDQP